VGDCALQSNTESIYIGEVWLWVECNINTNGINVWESVRDLQIACGQKPLDGLYVDVRRRFLLHSHASYCVEFLKTYLNVS